MVYLNGSKTNIIYLDDYIVKDIFSLLEEYDQSMAPVVETHYFQKIEIPNMEV
jgi:hypothetical protein